MSARLSWVLAITAVFMVAEAIGGVLSGSLALLADAGHMLTDVAALGLSVFAMRLSRRPPSTKRTFGYVRLEILAALVNGAALLVIAGLILLEAWERFTIPVEVDGASARIGGAKIALPGRPPTRIDGAELGVRPEYVRLGREGAPVAIRKVEDLGRRKVVWVALEEHPIAAIMGEDEEVPAEPETTRDFVPDEEILLREGAKPGELTGDLRPGFENIRVVCSLKSDAPPSELKDLVEYTKQTSPLLDMFQRPVPISASGTIGSPRISSQPRRSTSKGFMRTSAAGKGQLELCWSIALLIASRFLASAPLTGANIDDHQPPFAQVNAAASAPIVTGVIALGELYLLMGRVRPPALAGVTDQLLQGAVHAVEGRDGQAASTAAALLLRHRRLVRELIPQGRKRRALLSRIDEAAREYRDLCAAVRVLGHLAPRASDLIVSRGERLSAAIRAAVLEQEGVRATYVDALEIVRTDAHHGGAAPNVAAKKCSIPSPCSLRMAA